MSHGDEPEGTLMCHLLRREVDLATLAGSLLEKGGFYDSDAYNDELPYRVEVDGRWERMRRLEIGTLA